MVSEERFLLFVRALALLFFLYTSLSITLRSVTALLILLVAFYATGKRDKSKVAHPFLRSKESNLDAALESSYQKKIADFVFYDPEMSEVLDHFSPAQQQTHCIFSKTAKLWGAQPWDTTLTFEDNVCRSIPMFIKFTVIGKSLGLDGFLFELPAANYGKDPTTFGQGVHRLLKNLSDADPAGVHCMNKSYIDGRGWYFEFDRESMFITTFSPFYPSSHSRYSFEAPGCYVLFQPEHSFAAHNIEPDTPHTNWEHPVTIRDKIRVAYKKNGREYLIRDTVYYPTSHDIVKPLGINDEPVQWWKGEKQE